MFKVTGNLQAGVVEFTADTVADVDDLPTEEISAGSTCFVIENSSVYMLNNIGEWHEI